LFLWGVVGCQVGIGLLVEDEGKCEKGEEEEEACKKDEVKGIIFQLRNKVIKE